MTLNSLLQPILLAILPLCPTLRLAIFLADVFHEVPEASSIIFDLRGQFFADAETVQLERLPITV